MLFFEWAPVSVVPCLTALYAIPPNRQEPRCDGRRPEVGIAQPRNSSLDLSASWRTESCFLNLNRSFADATVNIADIGRVGVAIDLPFPLRNIWPKLARRADSVEASVSGLTTSGHDRSEEPRPGGREELSRTMPERAKRLAGKKKKKIVRLDSDISRRAWSYETFRPSCRGFVLGSALLAPLGSSVFRLFC